MEHTLRGRLGAALAAVLVAGSMAQAAITIETVPVGNVGNTADTAAHSGNPAGQGAVHYAYNIGKYEVTAGQYAEFLNAVAATDTHELYYMVMSRTDYGCGITRDGLSGSYTYSVDSAFVNRPVNFVSFWDATRFANWLHNGQPTGGQDNSTTEDGAYTLTPGGISANTITRNAGWTWAVTSEDEWYKAAHYNPATSSYYLYQTSSDTPPGRDMADISGNNANSMGTPYPIDSGMYTTVAGEFQNSESPYGTFDQCGNVWEWNEAVLAGMYRGIRGGAFSEYEFNFQSSDRILGYPPIEASNYGFRVSLVPEPASIGLLGLGIMGMLVRRRGAGR